MSNPVPPAVTYALAVSGAWLIYNALKGTSPLDEIRAALTGSAPPGQKYGIDTGGLQTVPTSEAGQANAADKSQPVPSGPCRPPAQLVAIGQGGHRLTPAAAQAFTLWQAAYGAPIPLTDSYRTCAVQAAGHAKDPVRFASAGTSAHTKGLAVDVNLQQLGAVPSASVGPKTPANQKWDRLYFTARQFGWFNPRGPGRGDGKEPWHFSYGTAA